MVGGFQFGQVDVVYVVCDGYDMQVLLVQLVEYQEIVGVFDQYCVVGLQEGVVDQVDCLCGVIGGEDVVGIDWYVLGMYQQCDLFVQFWQVLWWVV